jgi:hypothetical protein
MRVIRGKFSSGRCWPGRRRRKSDCSGSAAVSKNETVSSLIMEYEQTCEESRQTAARFAFDDAVTEPDMGRVSLRWIYVHMIGETARHVGHADILREQTDGAAGIDGDSAVTTWLRRIVVNTALANPNMHGAT